MFMYNNDDYENENADDAESIVSDQGLPSDLDFYLLLVLTRVNRGNTVHHAVCRLEWKMCRIMAREIEREGQNSPNLQ